MSNETTCHKSMAHLRHSPQEICFLDGPAVLIIGPVGADGASGPFLCIVKSPFGCGWYSTNPRVDCASFGRFGAGWSALSTKSRLDGTLVDMTGRKGDGDGERKRGPLTIRGSKSVPTGQADRHGGREPNFSRGNRHFLSLPSSSSSSSRASVKGQQPLPTRW